VKLVLVDPKRVELAAYRGIPHLLRPVVNDPAEALEAFTGLVHEMERRYKELEKAGARNIASYNEKGLGIMPYIVAVVDEMADLMMVSGRELEVLIVRLAQLARAVGIHLVLATQRPEVKILTGLIKSNIPSRIAFRVTSKIDSRVILDCNGAETLAGKGDMLMLASGMQEPQRLHGAWVSEGDVQAVASWLRG
jgi:S-DNA-T family DNA segregation ATPase FtsK/SpoIIIE